MKFFSFFKKSKCSGIVQQLKLEKEWATLDVSELDLVREYVVKSVQDKELTIEDVDLNAYSDKIELEPSELLYLIGSKANAAKQYGIAEKFYLLSLKREKDVNKKHRTTNKVIELYYKLREEKEDAIEQCIHFCLEDIKLYPKVNINDKEVMSFKRLAIVYENEKKYKEAIKVSELALKYGISDGTKGGYEGRIEKLKSKIM